ncbi:hypothetical protein AUJ68_00870 [Candidatus Woesearchaeota archaeon CG1_02_57_44]|nr:MAG: hypothetical protein AUJ68_00870 [Candidatus Woesearchaeota archaeon CG1_02_57_44]
MTDYYAMSADAAMRDLGSTPSGLSHGEALRRLGEYGPNALRRGRRTSMLALFFQQFSNALSILLVFAGVLSLFLGEHVESVAIFVILLLNALLGFVQEYRAERAMEKLQELSAKSARVLRDGKEHKIEAAHVVPGDLLILEAGDIVPADARLISVASMQIDEAALTGESVPSKKIILPYPEGTSITDQENMAFMGTSVTYGKGKAIVTATGMSTEFGKIAESLEDEDVPQTPLQKKFQALAGQIGKLAVVLIIIVLIAGTLHKTVSFLDMLLFALVLAVATIPVALPTIVTIGLSLGAKRLAKKNLLVKRLPAAESLGAATIIVSDKTGTITKNQMTVTTIYDGHKSISVTGTGYVPEGTFSSPAPEILLRISMLCNNAKLTELQGKHGIIGDPTEGALIVLARKAGLDDGIYEQYPQERELPFDSDRKMMSVICRQGKTLEAYVKGAPDLLLAACDRIWDKGSVRKMTDADRKRILDANQRMGEQALRVLGFAYRPLHGHRTAHREGAEAGDDEFTPASVERELIFVGLAGMIDPPRDEVAGAIAKCHSAGIRVMVVTGDHSVTAKAVGERIGLMQEGDAVITGEDVERMSDQELRHALASVRIIARAMPLQKLRIVTALQQEGHIVAMTGDGVNDAPALKKADIGIAMGITGTDVAKEVAKAVLVDDNFATIVNAIEEGRAVYDKMILSARYLLSCNSGEIGVVLFSILLGMPLPLIPLQVLMINLLTDTFPAMGLGMEKGEDDIMRHKPRDPHAPPLSRPTLYSILFFGLIMATGTLLVFNAYRSDLTLARTMAFTTLVLFQMFAVISGRTLHPSLARLNPFTNLWLTGAVVLSVGLQVLVVYLAPLQQLFGTVALSSQHWLVIVSVSSIGLLLMELSKFALGRSEARA